MKNICRNDLIFKDIKDAIQEPSSICPTACYPNVQQPNRTQ